MTGPDERQPCPHGSMWCPECEGATDGPDERTPEPLDPKLIRAEIARRGLHDLHTYWTPDHGFVNPLNDHEVQTEVRSFLGWLWSYCVRAES